MFSNVAVLLPLMFQLTITTPVPEPSNVSKRDVLLTTTPVPTPELMPGSSQTATLYEMIQSLWDSSGVRRTGVYSGKSQDFPLFGDCNVEIPSAVDDTSPANMHIYVNAPEPKPATVASTAFNIYMKSDPKYIWKSGQDCRDVCLDTVIKAAKAGKPSVECNQWVGPSANGNPGNSHCIAGYAAASEIGKPNSLICGS